MKIPGGHLAARVVLAGAMLCAVLAPAALAQLGTMPAAPTPSPTPVRTARVPDRPAKARGGRPERPPNARLALTLWQSAWGDFSNLDPLLAYLSKNDIRSVYFNGGVALASEESEADLKQIGRAVARLGAANVARISYYVAEPDSWGPGLEAAVRRLSSAGFGAVADGTVGAGVTIDLLRSRQESVSRSGLRYSAFLPVEIEGNSGVSDSVRMWAVTNLDETVLLSTLACDLDGQKGWLEKYLIKADAAGRRGVVRIGLLAGRAPGGREISCEKALDAQGVRTFIAMLDAWAGTFKSYGGMVILPAGRLPETDLGI